MENSKFFPEIHGNFGFGCMRLPMKGSEVDYEEFCRMADAFIDAGFNYFDTAHGYTGGKSETTIRDCVAKRYDRSRFILTNKLTDPYFSKQEDIRPFFEQQLAWCGVDHFDFYLMHAQDRNNYQKFRRCKAYETCYAFKQEGLIRHFGISFHDKAEVLDMILTEHPEIEIVQIQFNYVDYEDASVESRKVYEVCEKHGKPVIVMEPVKGGSLVNLPEEADRVLRDLHGGSNASYAIRFAASFPNMAMVLSGMSNMEQMMDNISAMKDFQPLNEEEQKAIHRAQRILGKSSTVPCTACSYCTKGCPQQIRIPDIFAAMNKQLGNGQMAEARESYFQAAPEGHRASDCVECRQCEGVCPQHLPITDHLKQAVQMFETKES